MIAQESIPLYTTLADVFGSVEASLPHAQRWNELAQEFELRFGRKPTYIARAPGRVNLIGEHIDYALFGVLPAAVERDILIACAARPVPSPEHAVEPHHAPGSVVAENVHPKYKPQVFVPAVKTPQKVSPKDAQAEAWHLDINTKELRWESYVKAGYFGVLNHHFVDTDELPVPVDLLVTGSVPAGSGLSSSAAMVVASTLAFLAVNKRLSDYDHVITKGTLVELAMNNEKRVGVNSGGMDQAASVMSDPSSALYITFFPSLHASAVPLPNGAVFVCANSLVVADKAVGAKRRYNLRVVETLVGARILANSLNISLEPKERITYRQVVGRYAGEKEGEEMDPSELEKILLELEEELDVLKPPAAQAGQLGATMEEMIEMSGLSKDAFHDMYLSWVEVEATHFQLYKRAKHVLSEARRVLQFRRACLEAEKAAGQDGDAVLLQRLGQLMNDSQESCSELFECSCSELNELTSIARASGAYGSRLTGAGWGGCTVSLVPQDKVDDFIQKVKALYRPYKDLEGDSLAEAIFATKPSRGACVYKLEP